MPLTGSTFLLSCLYFICSKQLYEAEDNSFYSEAIFNAGYLFQMLQVCSQLNFIAMIQINSHSYEEKCG